MDSYPAIISPAPTPPPNPQSVALRLQRNSLERRQAGAQTCGWWFGISCAMRLYLPFVFSADEITNSDDPIQCSRQLCAFDATRELFGCCPYAYLSQPCVLPGTCINYANYTSTCNAAGGGCSALPFWDATVWYVIFLGFMTINSMYADNFRKL